MLGMEEPRGLSYIPNNIHLVSNPRLGFAWETFFGGWDLRPSKVHFSGPLGSGSLGLFVQVP
jgi:hypothetical protein